MPAFTVRLDPSGVVRGAAKAKRAVSGLDSTFDSLNKNGSASMNSLDRSIQKVTQSVLSLVRADKAVDAMSKSLNRLQGALAGYLSLSTLISTANMGMDLKSVAVAFESITGSAQGAAREMAYITAESQRLGVNITDLAGAYKGFSAAGKAANLSTQQIKKSFTEITEVSVAMGLSSEKTSRTLYALEQMLSKGVVSMEELRQQLGDQLPGAFAIAAKAMGVTTQELTKMVEQGKVLSNEFIPKLTHAVRHEMGSGLAKALEQPRVEIGRFMTALQLAQAEVANAGFLDGIAAGARELRESLESAGVQDTLRGLGETLGTIPGWVEVARQEPGAHGFAQQASVGGGLDVLLAFRVFPAPDTW